MVEDSGDMDLFSILKDMGIIEDDSSDDSYQSHKQGMSYPNYFSYLRKNTSTPKQDLWNYDNAMSVY